LTHRINITVDDSKVTVSQPPGTVIVSQQLRGETLLPFNDLLRQGTDIYLTHFKTQTNGSGRYVASLVKRVSAHGGADKEQDRVTVTFDDEDIPTKDVGLDEDVWIHLICGPDERG
jgi:hypothetical protein